MGTKDSLRRASVVCKTGTGSFGNAVSGDADGAAAFQLNGRWLILGTAGVGMIWYRGRTRVLEKLRRRTDIDMPGFQGRRKLSHASEAPLFRVLEPGVTGAFRVQRFEILPGVCPPEEIWLLMVRSVRAASKYYNFVIPLPCYVSC